MKYIITILSAFSILFCSSKHQTNFSGIYRSPKNSKLNQFVYGTFVTELELNLKNDSTYTMSTCAQTSKGIWKLKNNKITLFCKEKRMAIDSLNQLQKFAKGKICGSDEVYNIGNEKLSREEKIESKNINFILLKD
ncbi:hypothetical protein [Chryseobacterium terrae]|uniref:Lipocalin-like domain-containing protein n=1 Tax=Chryseobacterium terrae TaxID=3163299 RepID=A0ABW8Y6T8_9FLAO